MFVLGVKGKFPYICFFRQIMCNTILPCTLPSSLPTIPSSLDETIQLGLDRLPLEGQHQDLEIDVSVAAR